MTITDTIKIFASGAADRVLQIADRDLPPAGTTGATSLSLRAAVGAFGAGIRAIRWAWAAGGES